MADETTDKMLTTTERFAKQKSDEDIAKEVHSDFTRAQAARSLKDATFLEQYKIYRFHDKRRKFPWRSDIYVPLGHVNVVVKTARLLTATLGADPFFKPVARNQMFAQAEEPVQNLMLKQHEEMEFPVFLHDWYHDMFINSVGIAKGYWKYEERVDTEEVVMQQPIYAQVDGQQFPIGVEDVKKKVKKSTVLFDGPMFDVVNIFDFQIDPQATSIKRARYVVHRKEVSIDYLREKAEQGIYKKEAVEKIAREYSKGMTDDPNKSSIDSIEGTHESHASDQPIEILEHWTKTTKRVAGPSNTLLQDRKNPFSRIPFFEIKHLRGAHKFWGIGVNEPVTTVLTHVNKTHRLRYDNWEINVQKMFVVDMGAIYAPSDIVARPGGIVRVKTGRDTSKAIQELHKSNLPMESYMEEEKLQQLNEIITGVTEPQVGVSQQVGEETATKTRDTQAGISTRFGVELILAEPAIKELLEFHHELNQKFLDQPRVVRIMGDEGYQYPLIGPDEVSGNFDFKFEMSPVQGNPEKWLQRLLLVQKQLVENPQTAIRTNWIELGRRTLKAAEIRNPDMILSDQNIMMNMQTMMMMQPPGATAENPEEGRMNAATRMPQPTPADMTRDMFAKAR